MFFRDKNFSSEKFFLILSLNLSRQDTLTEPCFRPTGALKNIYYLGSTLFLYQLYVVARPVS